MPRPASDGQISRGTGNVPPGLTGGARPETIWTDHRRWIRGIECLELCHGRSGLLCQQRSVSRSCINILILLFVDMGWGKHARVEWVGIVPYLLELQLRRLRGWYWQLSATTYHTQLLHGCWPSQRTFRRLHSMQDLFIFTCLSDRIIVE